jgi:hypothetical protein
MREIESVVELPQAFSGKKHNKFRAAGLKKYTGMQ